MIKVHNLSKNFGSISILKNIDFDFQAGLVYGIIGRNGAGKSTLFKCIAGLERYDGNIQSPWDPMKNYLGFLETNPIMIKRITAWEYLKLMCVARGISEENFEQKNIFQLPLEQYASDYSTGMKKKLALMGILLLKNQVFLLDEPFNGLDLESNMQVMNIINQLALQKKYVLISSHLFESLKALCDCILVLEDGTFKYKLQKESFDQLEHIFSADLDKSMMNRLLQ